MIPKCFETSLQISLHNNQFTACNLNLECFSLIKVSSLYLHIIIILLSLCLLYCIPSVRLHKNQRIIFQNPDLWLPILSIYFFSTSDATVRETVLREIPISYDLRGDFGFLINSGLSFSRYQINLRSNKYRYHRCHHRCHHRCF